MDKTNFLNLFEEKLRGRIIEFCNKVNDSKADLYILMARKAACFINALEELSMVAINGEVISERVLDTEIDWSNIRKIIIIDDVIISGTTLNRTIKKIKDKNPAIEIKVFVLGINEKWFNEELLQDDTGKSYLELPIKPLENSQCIKLSGDIVKMLAMMPTPYNIDYPIYNTLRLNSEDYTTMLNMPNWEMSDVCSYEQMKHNIFTKTFIPTHNCLISCGHLFFNDLIKDSLLKIRIYGKKKEKEKETFRFSIVPMAILPPLKTEQIIDLFNHLAAEKEQALSKILTSITAKLRFIQFVIADRLANVFIQEFNYFTGQNTVITRQYKSLRFLFPTCITNDMLKVADKSILNIDLQYNKTDIQLKNDIQSSYSIDNFVGINNTLNLPFLNMYYEPELKARKLAKQHGENVFDIPDYKKCLNRLNEGYSLLDLKNLLNAYSSDIQKRIVSTFLDKAIDNGIAVPITVEEENGTIYRAYRHGEDVQFGQREERLCYEMFNAFNKQVGKGEWQKLWVEKLMVFLLKIGENKFLTPIQTDIASYRNIDVASVKYYFQGPVIKKVPVEKFDKNPCLEYADRANWLSKDLLLSPSSPLKQTSNGMYSFDKELFEKNNNSDEEIIIEKDMKNGAVQIGSIFGMLIHNSIEKKTPCISTDDLIALSCCCEPKDAIGALAAEINLSKQLYDAVGYDNNVQNILTKLQQNKIDIKEGIKQIRKSPIYRAINDGQRKFKWYREQYPHEIIRRVSSELEDDIYKGIWDSFWSSNLSWTEESEDERKLTLAKKEGLWLLCANIYFLIAEYSLYDSEEENKKEDIFRKVNYFYQEIKNFASNSKVREIIPFVQKFIDKRTDNDYIKILFGITKLKIDSLFSQADEIINEAKMFYENYQRFPDMSYYTTALYVDCQDEKYIKFVDNLFKSVCFRITKSSTQQNATLKELPKYDNSYPEKRGEWYIGKGKDAAFWILQFAKEIINNLNGKDYFKIYYFADLLSNDYAVKVIDDFQFKYDNFWDFVLQFSEIIHSSDFQNNTIYEIRNSYMDKTIINENDGFNQFTLNDTKEIEIRLPNMQKHKLTEYKNAVTYGQSIERFNIGVITIVTEEVQAVISEFGLTNRTKKEGRFFDEGNINLQNGKNLKIVHSQSTGQGNIPIVNAYQSMIRNYTLDYVVLLGIAGSIKSDIKLCDVIIGTNVIYYEKHKETNGGVQQRRGEFYNMSFDMQQFINRFFVCNNEPAKFDSSENSTTPTFGTHRCPIGSGEAVIANNLSETKKWLLEVHSKTGVVETESAGFCQVFSETKNISEGMDIILIRGISDHADCDKDDKWRLPASKNAVIALKRLLEIIYE
ncbi:5'-methylthioadenosine/S-adenosylhomocysteine nucleosidase family protein [Viscerimonas tarda]